MTQNLHLKKGLKKGKTRHSPYFTNADVFPVAASVLAGRGDIRKYVTILRPPRQGAFAPIGLTGWFVYSFAVNLFSFPAKIQLERGNSSLCLKCIYIETTARET